MTDAVIDIYLFKAEESLAGAVSEYASRRYDNCANRAYYAYVRLGTERLNAVTDG
jgi:uncharacterized protein (UPF0332 family)